MSVWDYTRHASNCLFVDGDCASQSQSLPRRGKRGGSAFRIVGQLAAENDLHAGSAEQTFAGENVAIVLLNDLPGDGKSYALAWSQRIGSLPAIEYGSPLVQRDTGAIIFHQNMQVVVVGLTHGNFDKFQAVFAGVIQHVAHHFHKIILFADKADLRRDIETDIDPFALVNLVQRRGQLVEQRRNGV